jgi:hypothetical protein
MKTFDPCQKFSEKKNIFSFVNLAKLESGVTYGWNLILLYVSSCGVKVRKRISPQMHKTFKTDLWKLKIVLTVPLNIVIFVLF